MVHEWLTAAVASLMVMGSSSAGLLHRNDQPRNERAASTTARTISSADVACIAAAVAAREASLAAGMSAHGTASNAAYTARASALASAYTAGSKEDMRKGVKSAWDTFNASLRTAKKNWINAREGAWKTFRTAAKACGASTDVSDGDNASLEARGE